MESSRGGSLPKTDLAAGEPRGVRGGTVGAEMEGMEEEGGSRQLSSFLHPRALGFLRMAKSHLSNNTSSSLL